MTPGAKKKVSTFHRRKGSINLRLSLRSCGLQYKISNLFNLLTLGLGSASRQFSMQCLSKRWKGTAVSSICPSRSTPASLRHFRFSSCDLAGQNLELRVSQVGSSMSASTMPLDTCLPKASISPKVGRTSKSFMVSRANPASNFPSPRIEFFRRSPVGRTHCKRRKCSTSAKALSPSAVDGTPGRFQRRRRVR